MVRRIVHLWVSSVTNLTSAGPERMLACLWPFAGSIVRYGHRIVCFQMGVVLFIPKRVMYPCGMRLAVYQPDIALNLGAMIRLSACFDVPLDIIEPCGFPLSIKALKRSAMDYADIADLTRHDSWDAFQAAPKDGRVVLMTTRADDVVWDFKFQPNDTILMGRESAGVPQEVHDAVDGRVKLPMFGAARSLNVAMSAGMAVSEALRQVRS